MPASAQAVRARCPAATARRPQAWAAHLGAWTSAHAAAYLLRYDLDVTAAVGHFAAGWLVALYAARALATACVHGLARAVWPSPHGRTARADIGATLAASVALGLAAAWGGGPSSSIWLIDCLACLVLGAGVRLSAPASHGAPRATATHAPRATAMHAPQATVTHAPRATAMHAPQATVTHAPQAGARLVTTEVTPEELIGRAPVRIDVAAVRALVRGRTVMVTGAGGSIGAELCAQVSAHGPRRLVMIEQAEQPLFALEARLAAQGAATARRGYIANVCDGRRMRTIFLHERPDIVLHAAAHKHVAMMERNPGAAVRNNAVGTQVVAELAESCACAHFVLISTDKAVNPTSVMGASKRIAELFVQALAASSRTHFSVVRFGNVLGSQGSVVPIFRAQIAAGGPLTITHRDAQRYFMTPDEACRLVLQAAALGRAGALYLLDMGTPVRIAALAQALAARSGRVIGRDIAVEEIGLRPGEKLVEELRQADERFEPTAHPKIARARAVPRALAPMRAALAELDALCDQVVSLPQLEQVLRRIVPEYCPAAGQPPLDVVRPVAMYS